MRFLVEITKRHTYDKRTNIGDNVKRTFPKQNFFPKHRKSCVNTYPLKKLYKPYKVRCFVYLQLWVERFEKTNLIQLVSTLISIK